MEMGSSDTILPRKYYQAHKVEKLAYGRKYRREHRAECRAYGRRYYQKHKKKLQDLSRKYYREHKALKNRGSHTTPLSNNRAGPSG